MTTKIINSLESENDFLKENINQDENAISRLKEKISKLESENQKLLVENRHFKRIQENLQMFLTIGKK